MSQEVTQQIAGLPAQAAGQLLVKGGIKFGSVAAGFVISTGAAPVIAPVLIAAGAASALAFGGYGIYRYLSGTGRKALPVQE